MEWEKVLPYVISLEYAIPETVEIVVRLPDVEIEEHAIYFRTAVWNRSEWVQNTEFSVLHEDDLGFQIITNITEITTKNINTTMGIFSVMTGEIASETMILVVGEIDIKSAPARIYVPSNKTVEDRDESYITRVEELDKKYAESDITESMITKLSGKYEIQTITNDKFKKLLKTLITMLMVKNVDEEV
jgi:hypothetical protein